MPLRERRQKLEVLLIGSARLQYLEAFDNPQTLLNLF